ncbi:MAG: PAS domain S-box protein [Spirochaetales bacterium]|nr:PAS domain S-box protein [Spirochaetales bacterium]
MKKKETLHEKLVGGLSGIRNSVHQIDADTTDRDDRDHSLLTGNEDGFSLLSQSSHPCIVINGNATIRYVNAAFEKLTGFSGRMLTGKGVPYPWWKKRSSNEIKAYREKLGIIKSKKSYRCEECCITSTGETIWVEKTYIPVVGNGKFRCYISTWIDITRRKEIEDELRLSVYRFEQLFDHMSSGVAVFSAIEGGDDFMFVTINRAAEQIEKIKKEDVFGKSVKEIFPGIAEFGLFRVFQEVWQTGIPQHHPVSLYTDKRITGYRDNYVYKLPTGEIVAVYDDCTRQKQAEEALYESEIKFRSLVEQSKDGIVMVDKAGVIVEWNGAQETLSGLKKEDVVGKPISEIHKAGQHGDKGSGTFSCYCARIMAMVEELTGCRGKNPSETLSEMEIRHADGSLTIIESMVFPLKMGKGWMVGSINRDITQKKKEEKLARIQEERLIQANRLASLGILVSGVAHEINNPNQAIMTYAHILSETWKSMLPILEQYYRDNGDFLLSGLKYSSVRKDMLDYIKGISDSSKKIDTIVSDLKSYYRSEESNADEILDINAVVRAAMTLIQPFIRKTTPHHEVRYGEHIPPVKGNFRRLEQVVINLIENACQALVDPEMGVSINTRFNRDNDMIEIHVSDQGEGISQENLKKIKDPFFTTRRESGRTGLGLFISHSIVIEHGGSLDIVSESGKWTTAIVRLPPAR